MNYWVFAFSMDAEFTRTRTRTPSHDHAHTHAHASRKNSRYFHTLGYENIFLQKLDFFHTLKVLFHTLKNNFIP